MNAAAGMELLMHSMMPCKQPHGSSDYIRTFCRPGRELTSKLSEEGFFLITVSITLILWPLWPEKLAQEVVLAP